MDETPVWVDIFGTTKVNETGEKDVILKSTGHEKVRVSVCLATKADGTKLKPFIVFVGAKQEENNLNDEFKNKCVVTSSPKGWMNEELTLHWS